MQGNGGILGCTFAVVIPNDQIDQVRSVSRVILDVTAMERRTLLHAKTSKSDGFVEAHLRKLL